MTYTTAKHQELESLTLVPIGDLHIGAKTSRYKELVKAIDKQPDNVYYIFLGDVIDNAIKTSIADPHDNTMTPDEALDVFEDEILEKIKGKVLGMVSGNHENRTKRQASTDLLKRTAKRFSIPYDPEILVLDLTIGNRKDGTDRGYNYVVAFGHGTGGGRQTGGKINAAQRLTGIVNNADLLITGHSHQPAWWKVPCGSVDRRNKNYVVNSIPNMIVPAWLGYEEYAQRNFYPPSPFAEVKVILSGKEKDMTFILK